MIPAAWQASDYKGAKALLAWLPAKGKMLVADPGCDAAWIRNVLKEKGTGHCIPSRRKRKDPVPHDPDAHESRHVIENSFARLKFRSRVATRCDRCPNVYLSACALGAQVGFRL